MIQIHPRLQFTLTPLRPYMGLVNYVGFAYCPTDEQMLWQLTGDSGPQQHRRTFVDG